jgi:hypothetical protein
MRDEGFFGRLVGDGRPLLFIVAGGLFFAGGFALFVSASAQLLPHDQAYLGMGAQELCAHNCQILDFMIHDRVAWGGMMMGLATLYAWLVAFPLSAGRAWAWWTLVASWIIGAISFLSYLGTGYLDTWHGAGTLMMVPLVVAGLWRTRQVLLEPGMRGVSTLVRPAGLGSWQGAGFGRAAMLIAALAMGLGGLVILAVGAGQVFVSQDMDFMHTTRDQLEMISPRLVALIAHDRQGFGGTVAALGLTAAVCVWCASLTRALWQALFVAWVFGSAGAIGIHLVVGYTNMMHLAPAILGAVVFGVGLALSARPAFRT